MEYKLLKLSAKHIPSEILCRVLETEPHLVHLGFSSLSFVILGEEIALVVTSHHLLHSLAARSPHR